jgi:hypothetical protein
VLFGNVPALEYGFVVWLTFFAFVLLKSLHSAENSGSNTRNSASAFPAGFPADLAAGSEHKLLPGCD